MEERRFSHLAMVPGNPDWEKAIARQTPLYSRGSAEIRSEFGRDYTRILHSNGYRRLKHKTQVFFNAAGNDHICTRIEHVAHVESVSATISKSLGLNEELTMTIAIGHDIGHSPFGHQGERIIKQITEEKLEKSFWHERNGVHFVDNIELLLDPQDIKRNLDLTYAVRDGIISHCGEVDHNCLKPREEYFDLMKDFTIAGQYNAATWEGCVVKLSDKIAYIGRDIEDADLLGYFTDADRRTLKEIARKCKEDAVNTTVVTHSMIADVCANSTPEKGLCFSPEMFEILTQLKNFNMEKIYLNPRLLHYQRYAELIIRSLFDFLMDFYDGIDTFKRLDPEKTRYSFVKVFAEWLALYCRVDKTFEPYARLAAQSADNLKIYGKLETEKIYTEAVIDFIAGMTDNYAESAFRELISC